MAIQRFSKGDLVRLRASDWNKLAELAESAPPPPPHVPGGSSALVLRVRNNAGRTVPRGGVLGLGAMPFTDLALRDNSRVVEGYAPVEERHFWRFAVAKEPIRPAETGICLVQGVALVRVFVRSPAHWFAAPMTGMVEGLVSCQDGEAQILVKENEAALGLQWCWVRLSNTPGRLFRLTSCDDPNLVIYTNTDLSSFIDRLVKLEGQDSCWLVEFVGCDDDRCKDPVCVEVVGVHDQCADCRDCWKLTDCSNASNIKYTGTDLSFYDGRVVKLQGDPTTCWQVAREKQNCSNLVDVAVEEDFDQCSDCICWKLTNCHDETNELWTTTNLAKHLGVTADQAKGKIVELLEYAGCWKVADYGSQYCSAQSVSVTVKNERDDCSCPCLVLTDCSNSSNTMLVTRAVNAAGKVIDLEQYVGQVVRDSTGTCWQVAKLTDPALCAQHTPGGITVLEAYDDCSACTAGLIELTKCGTTTKIKTYSDLSPWGQVALGNVYVDENGDCWEVTATGLAWDQNAVDFYAVGTAADCSACSQAYKLVVDCRLPECTSSSTPRDLVVADPRLAGHVGQYVKLGGWCYKISTTTAAASDSLQDWDGRFYEDCASCLNAPLTGKLRWPIGVCEDTDGKLKFRWGTLIYRDGLPVGFCDEGCEKPPACTNECDTGSGGSGGGSGGGGSGITCDGCSDIPTNLTATFTDGSGGYCACLDGLQVQLTWDANQQKWTGSTPACGNTLFVEMFCDGATDQLILAFGCGAVGNQQITLTITQCNGAGGFEAVGNGEDSTCCSTPSGPAPISVTVTG